MSQLQPNDFLFYYGAALLIALIVFMRRRPRRGMRLRLRGGFSGRRAEGRGHLDADLTELPGAQPPGRFSHIRSAGERPLNVVFNYNGHSWDAYEVLGLPAGSAPDKVEAAFTENMAKINAESRPFIQAAYDAIQEQWRSFRAAGGG